MKFLSYFILIFWIVGLTTSAQAQATPTPELDPLIYINAVAWSHDGSKIAAAGIQQVASDEYAGYLFVIDANFQQLLYTIHEPLTGYYTVEWSSDDRRLAVSIGRSLHILAAGDGSLLASLTRHSDLVTSVSWSPDDSQLVSVAPLDQQAILWDMKTYQPIRTLEIGDPCAVAFSPDGQQVAIGGVAGVIIVPASLNIGVHSLLNYEVATSYVGALAWNSDGTQIAYGTQTFKPPFDPEPSSRLYILDSGTGVVIRNIITRSDSIFALAWSPLNDMIATYSGGGSVKIWDTSTGSLLDSFAGNSGKISTNLSFSPYGGRLAYGITIDPTKPPPDDVFERSGIRIVAPIPSIERLNAISRRCDVPTAISSPQTLNQLDDYLAQIKALPTNTISPVCLADLLVVSDALE